MYVAKTKALFCSFVFAYAKSRFSHDAAQLSSLNLKIQVSSHPVAVQPGLCLTWSETPTQHICYRRLVIRKPCLNLCKKPDEIL